MPKPEIEEFAKILVQSVRDNTIQECDRDLLPNAKSLDARRWKKALRTAKSKAMIKMVVPDIVDSTIFSILWAIDHGVLEITYTASNGKKVNLSKEGLGELGGWYMGSGGWRAMYSKERFIDDFADLK